MVIADGCPVFLCGLISILRAERDFGVVACCSNGIESLQAIRNLSPDIALLDCSMPMGLNALATAISEGSRTRIVLLAAPVQLQAIFAVAIGAYGIVPTNVRPEALVHSLRRVAEGQRLSSRELCVGEPRSGARYYATKNALASLSERERQIANLVSEGLSNKAIGQQLKLTPGTIKVHLHNIFSKLARNNRTALTALAVYDRYKISHGGRHT
jgi:two-component system, NarL family, nitrate/nitrite response regulator NarL